MPKPRLWLGVLILLAGPKGHAEEKPTPEPLAVAAPKQPSAALLEFIGTWNPDERQLIGMETKVEAVKSTPQPQQVRRAR